LAAVIGSLNGINNGVALFMAAYTQESSYHPVDYKIYIPEPIYE
jgi:hypothetical protein